MARNQQKSQADYEKRLEGYKEVPDRIVEFYEKYPTGILTRVGEPTIVNLTVPVFDDDGKKIGERAKTFIQYTAAAYRSPDDTIPGIGTVWEPFPGGTPYTKDSEMMNAETSAWGRALVAIGIVSKGEKIASREEVMSRAGGGEEETTATDPQQAPYDNPLELAALIAMAAATPQATGKDNAWAQQAVKARLAYYAKKKTADPVQAVFDELLKALPADAEVVHEAAKMITQVREGAEAENEQQGASERGSVVGFTANRLRQYLSLHNS